jgi:hypothetical protein
VTGVVDGQPWLDFDPVVAPDDEKEVAAREFHLRNPHVMAAIIDVALRVRAAGRRHWSINAAFEVVRYNASVTTDGRTYKLNNNHRAYYARWIMRDVPDLEGFFETRDQGRVEQEYDE